ncbi:glycine zipper 2TM domain-containing protein [Roseateles sp. DAIF2]|nr:glycine zipper 2TM domain-containing protein [Roseateles sp. DAIF2]
MAASAQVTLYEREGFEGSSWRTSRSVADLQRAGFNDRASSALVVGGRWEACEHAGFGGRCVLLRQGRYPSLSAVGLNERMSSLRPIGRYAREDEQRPEPAPLYDARRRNNERLYQAEVTGSRAVVATSERRCWLESDQLPPERRQANVPAAIAGAVIGGILGHQVGGGSGRDLATAGGLVAGGLIGAQMGRSEAPREDGERAGVRRCRDNPEHARTEYWDVSYRFRGQEHRVQMDRPPGATVTVNRQGEPRG